VLPVMGCEARRVVVRGGGVVGWGSVGLLHGNESCYQFIPARVRGNTTTTTPATHNTRIVRSL